MRASPGSCSTAAVIRSPTTDTDVRTRAAGLDTAMLLAVGAAGMSLLTAWVLVTRGPTAAAALALLPALALGIVYLVTSGQVLLWAAAVALPFWLWPVFGDPLSG